MDRRAVCIALATLRLVSARIAIDGCSGTADNCASSHNYTALLATPINLLCQERQNISQVSWFINGDPVNVTASPQVYFKVGDPLHRFTYWEKLGSMGSDIKIIVTGLTAQTTVHNFTCSFTTNGGERTSLSYLVCVISSTYFTELQPDFSWLQDVIMYATPGSTLTLQCSFYFGAADSPYNYSIAWLRAAGNEVLSYGYRNNCTVLGERLYERNLTIVKAANVSEEEYTCEIQKVSNWNSTQSSKRIKQFYIRTLQGGVLTYAEIGGVSSSAAIVVALIVYVSWRLSILLRCFVHHVLNLKRHPRSGATPYDALVSFNDDSQLASVTAFTAVREKVENKWRYRLCFPQRDFVPGDDMAQSLMEVIDRSQKCIFIMDSTFFESRWCLTALQHALKCHHKIIGLLLMDKNEMELHADQIDPIAKVGVLINWRTENIKQSRLKRLFLPHYRWASLKLHLPPNPSLYRSMFFTSPDETELQSRTSGSVATLTGSTIDT